MLRDTVGNHENRMQQTKNAQSQLLLQQQAAQSAAQFSQPMTGQPREPTKAEKQALSRQQYEQMAVRAQKEADRQAVEFQRKMDEMQDQAKKLQQTVERQVDEAKKQKAQWAEQQRCREEEDVAQKQRELEQESIEA